MNRTTRPCGDAAGCPIRSVLAVIAAKWPMLIIDALKDGNPRFFGELTRAIPDISPKMLSQSLKMLVAEGLVSRTVLPEIPPRTRYRLTPYGQTLLNALTPLTAWALAHLRRPKT